MCRCLMVMVVMSISLGCSGTTNPPAADQVTQPDNTEEKRWKPARIHTLSSEHLPNLVQIHSKVISGGLPEGDAAFEELKTLGVKTVISVDGTKPDVETAARHGLRYVHLPHGYDGIPQQRAKELAKAVRDLEGRVYIHCHHGQHRSPAAASVACVTAGLIDPSQALEVLELAGTSPNYRGLFQSASSARPLEKALLDELQVEFRETVEIPPLAEAMVALEHTHDHLKQISAAGWHTPGDHPDLTPAYETLLLREHFRELLRTDLARQQPEDFQQFLRDSEATAAELETTLRSWNTATDPAPEALNHLADRIAANCKSCHQKYRDVPLEEK